MRFTIWSALVSLSLGCAATSGGLTPVKRTNPFPAREALAKIEAQPVPSGVFDKVDDIRVPEWTLVAPLPDVIGPTPRTATTDVERLAEEVAGKAPNGVATEAMTCLAHQLGEFYLAYGGSPEKSLKRFMEHRCGVTSEFTSSSWSYWEQQVTWEAANKDGRTIEQGRTALEQLVKRVPNPEVGAWFGSNAERSVAMFVAGARAVDLEPMPMLTQTGSVEIAGRFLIEGVDIVGGAVNIGDYDAAACHALPAELPAFRVRCDARPTDLDAGFEIYTQRRGDLIASSRLWQLVWPSGVIADTFVLGGRPKLAEVVGTEGAAAAAPVRSNPEPLEAISFDTSPAAMSARMLDRVNVLRGTANLGPVTLAEKQSGVATELAPHYWGALQKGEHKTTQDIAFGLLAGWEVEGAIINGSLYAVWVNGGPDDLVADLAARPGARDVLFGPDIATLSIGPHFDADAGVMGGIVHGWEFVPDESHLRRVNRFLDYVSDARAARSNPKPNKVASLNSIADELATKLQAGEIELHHAAYRLMGALAQSSPGQRAMVYYTEVHDPTKIELPDAILDAVPLEMTVVVAPYKVPNAPWHTYGVVFAYLEVESPTKVAELAVPVPNSASPR